MSLIYSNTVDGACGEYESAGVKNHEYDSEDDLVTSDVYDTETGRTFTLVHLRAALKYHKKDRRSYYGNRWNRW